MDGPHTLGRLVFNTTGGGSYTITGTDTLTMDSGLVPATVSVLGGSHTIAVPVALASDLAVNIAGGSGLTISGPISETTAGRSLSLGGAGTLLLTNAATYTGATNVTGGTLELGAGANIPNTTALTVGSNGVLAVDSGASLNVNGNVSIATPLSLAGTMTISSPTATIAMADFLMTGGSCDAGHRPGHGR